MPTNEYKNLHGTTMTFGTQTTLALSLITLDLPELATTEIDDTDLASTVKKTFAGAVKDAGEVSVTARYLPGLAIAVGAADEAITITFPLLTGQTTAGKFVFNGHITKRGGTKASADGRAETSLTIKCNSVPVWTEGT
jgi:hypothetical protein